LTYFLGFEVARSVTGIHLSQCKYTLDLLKDTGMLDSTHVSTPMHVSKHKVAENTNILPDPTPYRRLIGRLIYLTHTQPDITYVVHFLSQFVVAPTSQHHQASMRILRYLKNAPSQGIFLQATCDLQFKAFSNSDWASCSATRRSVT